MSDLQRGTILARAMSRRTIREAGVRLLAAPALLALVALGVCAVIYFAPVALTPVTAHAIRVAAAKYFPNVADFRMASVLAFVFLQMPYLVAMGTALASASLARALVAADSAQGSLEMTLTLAYSPRSIFIGLVMAAFGLAALCWIALMLPFLALVLGLVAIADPQVPFPLSYALLTLVMPLPLALWGSLIAITLAVWFPKSFSMKRGSLTGVMNLPIIFPAVIVFFVISFNPNGSVQTFMFVTVLLVMVGCTALASWIFRRFKVDVLLANQ
jgi:hypothetical protein